MKTRPRVACLQCSRTTWSIVTSHKDCFSQFLKLIMSWDTIRLIHLTLEHLKGLQVLLSLRASWASRLFEQGWADAELPGIPIVRNMGRLQERGTSGFPLMSLNGTLSSLSSVFVPLWCVIDDDIFSKTYLSLRFIQPDTACSVAHLFSALPCDFQHLLSPFWFFWPESDLTRALFPPFLSQPKRPLNPTLERFLRFCAVCPSVVSDQWGEALALCCTLWNCLFNYCPEGHQTCFTFRDPGHCHMIASMVSLTLWPDPGSSDSYDLQKVFIYIRFIAEVEPPKWGSLEDAFSAVTSSSPASKTILSYLALG